MKLNNITGYQQLINVGSGQGDLPTGYCTTTSQTVYNSSGQQVRSCQDSIRNDQLSSPCIANGVSFPKNTF
jgi:hypothetical protein